MTIKFENTNDSFGMAGPFEADSKEALADDVADMLNEWARKRYDDDEAHCKSADEDEMNMPREEWISEDVARLRAEFIDGLVAVWTGEPRVIFDNAGGITLQLPGYAHTYDDAEQCATDIKDWLDDEDTSDWDGNEEDAVIDPTQEQIANGGHDIHSIDYFIHLSPAEVAADYSWGNIRDLYVELAKKIMED